MWWENEVPASSPINWLPRVSTRPSWVSTCSPPLKRRSMQGWSWGRYSWAARHTAPWQIICAACIRPWIQSPVVEGAGYQQKEKDLGTVRLPLWRAEESRGDESDPILTAIVGSRGLSVWVPLRGCHSLCSLYSHRWAANSYRGGPFSRILH